MDRRQRLLERLRRGHHDNVDFKDFCDLIESLGWELRRIKSSHRNYRHPRIPSVLTVLPEKGRAKRYQIRELLRYVEDYHLSLRNER
jgi:predicted RNA binding protein YcfA (HicA-like mRNA interferase family)